MTEKFCLALSERKNICPHFHLSLQSGCDKILKNMHRKYDTARFMQSVELLRASFSSCGLTADLITGFPGETEEDHRETLEFIQKCAFSSMHVFPYSQRPGTKAAAMPGQLTHAIKNERARQAQQAADDMERAFLEGCIGQAYPVLFESKSKGLWHGHAGNYCLVAAEGEDLHGAVRNVKITDTDGKVLFGNII